jgi:hypothetical protein
MTIFSLSLVCGHLVVFQLVLNLKFNFVHLELSVYSLMGRLRNQMVCTLVYMCDE